MVNLFAVTMTVPFMHYADDTADSIIKSLAFTNIPGAWEPEVGGLSLSEYAQAYLTYGHLLTL